ncbi:terminase [Alloscardovia theropitheci]|uniref:Terminase n=1 Tax=Alloscardovia theropitheci TaxID=2496842 RepID=A0A4R0QW92_9BIFI|nr:terminase family protein [Alloscardovia theropitheci]TCD53760.1 terminase [Alloscardovia theropitheci]
MTLSSDQSLNKTAHHLIYPEGIVSTEWSTVSKLAHACEINFDTWQNEFGMYMLGKRSDGRYAASVGGIWMSLPRQIGKTYLVGNTIIMLALARSNLKVVWTAHHTRTSTETFTTMTGLINKPTLSNYVNVVRRANGQQEISFTNGSRIMFGAREQGFGRGMAGVDMIVFDECQILTEAAMEDMVPMTNASSNPLVFYMGTPPRPKDPGEAFRLKRLDCISGRDTDTLFVEFSADREADLDDRSQWRKANPSYPERTSESAILRMRRQLSDDSFRREALGVWDMVIAESAINPELWDKTAVSDKPEGGNAAFALDMNPDRTQLTLAACMKYENGTYHTEDIMHIDPQSEDVSQVFDFLAERKRSMLGLAIDSNNPAMVYLPELTEHHIKPLIMGYRDAGIAAGRFLDLLNTGKLTHLPEPQQQALYSAVHGAIKRPIGKAGAFAWNKMGADVNISPLVACTNALHMAAVSKRKPGRKVRVMI